MSEIMRPISFDKAVRWMLDEYADRRVVFGVPAERFYCGPVSGPAVGPAAGPHSQLCQNIVAAYLAGARFIELKTVQQMDGEELRKCIARPCINAADEGYNVEWSTELTVGEAMDEYIKAWFLLHVAMAEFELSPDGCDFAFNMSVGYSLDGIRAPKLDGYIEGMKDACGTTIWQECTTFLKEHIGLFRRFNLDSLSAVSPRVANSVTLSTLHGCPKEEIERIAAYLITEKSLDTYVKCNPTLLGYTFARGLLDEMGYGYLAFDTHHFDNDLQFDDAVGMFTRLTALAKEHGSSFGVKLTNTFPVQIKRNELPGEEMYLSGRALYPLTLSLAAKIAGVFGEALPISFSGGADHFNIAELLQAGIRPVTVATTLLKPGGYARLNQLAQAAGDIAPRAVDYSTLAKLADHVSKNERHRKAYRSVASRKIADTLPIYDCAVAPCTVGCPINQRIPYYLRLVSEGDYASAYAVIVADNAAPAITGLICNHKCQSKCTRIDCDDSLRVRYLKQLAVENAADAYLETLTPPPLRTDKKAVVIGGGPAGMATALYLRRNGMDTTVLEKREQPYGVVNYVIPAFRIPQQAIAHDRALVEKTGVRLCCNSGEGYDLSALKREYDYVIIATGAWGRSDCGVDHAIDALTFLEDAKAGKLPAAKNVCVIGGGDVAMDCARVAKRAGIRATIVYRRTKAYMPAEREELELAEADGVEFMELLAPVSYDGANLVCDVMELGDYGADGRRGIKRTGTQKTLAFDAVISATGAVVDASDCVRNQIEIDAKGCPKHDENNETSLQNVFVAGDCKTGPATIVKAMADAKLAAAEILRRENLVHDFADLPVQSHDAAAKEGAAAMGELMAARDGCAEGARCLACHAGCGICTEVCPNRANILLPNGQILHIDGMCNECGNCASFCPYENAAPYKDKVTLFHTVEAFEDSENIGFVRTGEGFKVRREDRTVTNYPGGWVFEKMQDMIRHIPDWCE